MSIRPDGQGKDERFRVLLQGSLLESFKTYNEAVQFIKDNVELVK
jgi:hypothetical protein